MSYISTSNQPQNIIFPQRERERERRAPAFKIFSYENILDRYYDCRKRKRFTINAAKFEINLESNLLKLQEELKNHTYKPGRSICFVVSKPKLREVFAADFRDRVVHHILVYYLESVFDSKFIYQSYACRRGRGAHKAIKDLNKYIRKVNNDVNYPASYLQLDIQSFFVSLKKDILFELIKKHVKNQEILWLAETIIFHNPVLNYYCKSPKSLFDAIPSYKSLFKTTPREGLPIGNLTSQFFANVYLNELDQFIKHQLKIKYYIRYVDDFIILSKNVDELKVWREEIEKLLWNKLKLKLHPKKQILQKVKNGINFVGFIVKPDYILIRRRIVKNFKEKLKIANNNINNMTEEKIMKTLAIINSYYGQFKHSQSFGLRRKLWLKDFDNLQKFFEPVDKNLSYFKIKE